MLPRRRYVCVFEAQRNQTSALNIELCPASQSLLPLLLTSSHNSAAAEPADVPASSSPCVEVVGRFGSPAIVLRRADQPTASHNGLQDNLDWTKIDCHDFLRLAKEVPVDELFECIVMDKMYSKTGERTWDLTEFVLQRKDRRMFIGGQGVVLFVRRQGHSASLAMKVCYHKREEKKVERLVQRTILHLKAQGVSQFVGRILVNYLTRRFFITVMPKAKFASLKSLKQEVGPLSEANVRYYFACIVSAVVKLHAINICHRDIKCDNVLLTHSGVPALIDFGLSVKGSPNINEYRPNIRITQMQYYPPETKLVGQPMNDYKIDSWLLGFFLAEMLLNDREHLWSKFKGSSQKDWAFALCSECHIPRNSDVTTVLAKLLLPDNRERIQASDLQLLPYLLNNSFYSNIETMEPPEISGSVSDNTNDKDLLES